MPAITQSLTLRLPVGLLEQIDARASEAGMSRNAWLVALLSTYSEMEREVNGPPERFGGTQYERGRLVAQSGGRAAQQASKVEQSSVAGGPSGPPVSSDRRSSAPAEQLGGQMPPHEALVVHEPRVRPAREFQGSYDPFKKR